MSADEQKTPDADPEVAEARGDRCLMQNAVKSSHSYRLSDHLEEA